MTIGDLEWEYCSPSWVHRHNACGTAIRRLVFLPPCAAPIGHEHLMNQGSPVLWEDALAGQRDRLVMEASENAAFAADSGEPF